MNCSLYQYEETFIASSSQFWLGGCFVRYEDSYSCLLLGSVSWDNIPLLVCVCVSLLMWVSGKQQVVGSSFLIQSAGLHLLIREYIQSYYWMVCTSSCYLVFLLLVLNNLCSLPFLLFILEVWWCTELIISDSFLIFIFLSTLLVRVILSHTLMTVYLAFCFQYRIYLSVVCNAGCWQSGSSGRVLA
jgi:hypothetical protein